MHLHAAHNKGTNAASLCIIKPSQLAIGKLHWPSKKSLDVNKWLIFSKPVCNEENSVLGQPKGLNKTPKLRLLDCK